MSESIGQMAVQTNRCPRCLRRPGEQCVTKSGGRAGYAHAARCAPVLAGWHAGFEDMARDLSGMSDDRAAKYVESILRFADQRRT